MLLLNFRVSKILFLHNVLPCNYSIITSLDGVFTQSIIPQSSCESEFSSSKLGSLSPHPQLEVAISDDTGSASTLGMWQFALVLNPRSYNMEN